MGDFRKLEVWQRARLLNLRIYQLTRGFPTAERFGLVTQIRRASVSILANLAEGAGRNRDGELGRYVSIAQGSAAELECEFLIARDLGYWTTDEAGEMLAEIAIVRRMLTRLSLRLGESRRPGIRKPIANSS